MEEIEIFRGPRNLFELQQITLHNTAGGRQAAQNPTAPTPQEYEQYNQTTKATAGECMPPGPWQQIITNFTEYSRNPEIAKQFGRRCGHYIVAKVNKNYVKEFDNDGLEAGVLLRSDTPIKIQHVIEV